LEDKYLEGLVTGDREVIREIYNSFLESSIGWISRNGGERSDALDVFQEGLTQILIKAKKNEIKLESNFGAYLLGTCKYLWLGRLRQKKRYQEVRSTLKSSQDYEVHEEFFGADNAIANVKC